MLVEQSPNMARVHTRKHMSRLSGRQTREAPKDGKKIKCRANRRVAVRRGRQAGRARRMGKYYMTTQQPQPPCASSSCVAVAVAMTVVV